MKTDFDNPPDRRNSDSVKWRLYGPDVLPLWVADMDFQSPEPVLRALRERVEHGVFGYPEGVRYNPKELPELRRLIIQRLESLYSWQVEPEDLIIQPGVAAGFNLACHMVKEAQGEVLVQTPLYPPILRAPAYAGMQVKEEPLCQQDSGFYEIDFDSFESAISDHTRLFILCNPHNPVGRVFNEKELMRMAEICLKNDVTICSDEIHCDLVFSGNRHIPIASLDPEIGKNTVTLMAPSKTFNIAGLKVSFAIIQNPDLRRKFLKAQQGLVSWVNILGLTAAHAAYSECQDWLDQLLTYLEANRDFVQNFVNNELPGIQMSSPEGTYLAWLDCQQARLGLEPNPDPFRFFLEKAKVALNDGKEFGKGGGGFVRLNFGCARSTLEKALGLMKEELLLQIR
jgi:cysteine-S-conjugate beta-lyase